MLPRVALLFRVLRRRRCSNQRGVHDRAAGQPHAVGQEQLTHLGKQRIADLVFFHDMAKHAQRRTVRYALYSQVDPAEQAEHLNVS